MRKQSIWFILLLAGALLAACSQKETEKKVPTPVQAEISVPDHANVNEEVLISTTITQDGTPVDDADEVKYEVWKEGSKEESEMIEAASEGDGVYTMKKTFDEEAVYTIQVHVTARSMHTMPKSSIAVGNAVIPAESEKQEMNHDMEGMDH